MTLCMQDAVARVVLQIERHGCVRLTIENGLGLRKKNVFLTFDIGTTVEIYRDSLITGGVLIRGTGLEEKL